MPGQTKSITLLTPFPDIFSDLRVRYGIKLSLASLLSLYVALVLRLEHPNWAVLTTLVMMNSHYVGSTSLKAILRCVARSLGHFLESGWSGLTPQDRFYSCSLSSSFWGLPFTNSASIRAARSLM